MRFRQDVLPLLAEAVAASAEDEAAAAAAATAKRGFTPTALVGPLAAAAVEPPPPPPPPPPPELRSMGPLLLSPADEEEAELFSSESPEVEPLELPLDPLGAAVDRLRVGAAAGEEEDNCLTAAAADAETRTPTSCILN